MNKTRTEKDSMGEVEVPADALYGAQTQRAVLNFPVSQQRMPVRFIKALIQIKKAAARANQNLETLSQKPSSELAIARWPTRIWNSIFRLMSFRPAPVPAPT